MESYIQQSVSFVESYFKNGTGLQWPEDPSKECTLVHGSPDLVTGVEELVSQARDLQQLDAESQPTAAATAAANPAVATLDLNQRQKWVVKLFRDHLVNERLDQLLILMHGGPGTGKSTVINTLINEVGSQYFKCLAPTGIAATLLYKGATLHSFLRLRYQGKTPQNQKLHGLKPEELLQLKEELKGVRVLIIDEISMVSDKMLNDIDERLQAVLQNRMPFGGLSILASGDFYQIPPVLGNSLAAMKTTNSGEAFKGQTTFKLFRKIELTVQNRAATDEIHTRNIERCRDPHNATNAKELCMQYETLHSSPSSPAEKLKWFKAPVVVVTNEERLHLNIAKLRLYASFRRLPIITWKKEPTGTAGSSLRADFLHLVHSQYPETMEYFVPGVPGVITDNINIALGVANGTRCEYHSLTLDENYEIEDMAIINAALPGQIVEIHPPRSINVILNHVHKSQWPNNASLMDNQIVIPIGQGSRKLTTLKNLESISFKNFKVRLFFATTFHKIQGQTLDAVILDVNKDRVAVPM